MIEGLEKKEVNYEYFANNLLKNSNLISHYLEGLYSKNQLYMENCYNVLKLISEKKPNFLYSHWDFFVDYMHSENHYHKTAAVIILSNLTSADKDKRFETIFDDFFSVLKTEKTMAPMHLIKNSSKIINNKPELEDKVTDIFLNIDSIHPGKQIELVKSAVIESFKDYFPKAKNKKKIINFVEKQLDSSSPKTRKQAKDFLDKFRS